MSHKAKPRGDNPSPATKWLTKVSDENPDLLKKAQEELNENPEQRDQDIQTLREMVLGEENLKSPIDDAFLLKFLRGRKFDVTRAFALLKLYYSVRHKYSVVYVNYRPSSLLNFFSSGAAFVLPYRDQLGRAIIVVRTAKWDSTVNSYDDYIAVLLICAEHALMEEETQVNGFVFLGDMSDFSFHQALQITPNSAKRSISLFQNCLPGRLKGIRYIFEPALFNLVFMISRPFFNQKMKSRISFHGNDVESLQDHIDAECLPEDYGGLRPHSDVPAAEFLQKILAREDEIVDQMKNYGYTVA